WMNEQMGWRGMVKQLKQEAPQWATLLPQLPRKLDEALQVNEARDMMVSAYHHLLMTEKRRNGLLWLIAILLAVLCVILAVKL
ncbi:MAG: ubiquinone biosynthesis regulatory protein kinase UbiB, partial [Aquaspirillum sp.]|nr:ubiquinone biosynthesis regulatory protein kinase UbiB [Aquaspirillum sp.]